MHERGAVRRLSGLLVDPRGSASFPRWLSDTASPSATDQGDLVRAAARGLLLAMSAREPVWGCSSAAPTRGFRGRFAAAALLANEVCRRALRRGRRWFCRARRGGRSSFRTSARPVSCPSRRGSEPRVLLSAAEAAAMVPGARPGDRPCIRAKAVARARKVDGGPHGAAGPCLPKTGPSALARRRSEAAVIGGHLRSGRSAR
jgi:hypothetical protein